MDMKRILIADDDPSLRRTLFDALKVKGYAPIAAATGKAALDRAKEEMPAVALIELKLPDRDGLEVVREFKACSPGTVCIALTGYASLESAIEAGNLGVYSYVKKPYDMEQLLLTIRRAIEKQEADEVLRESEERYRSLFEESKDGIYIATREGEFVFINQAILDLLGYTRKGFGGLRVSEIYADPGDYESFRQEVEQNGFVKECEVELRKKDRTHIDCLLSATVWRDREGRIQGYQSIIHDITERKQIEQELIRLERLRALGEMSAGVSHNLNNILTNVMGPAQFLERITDDPAILREARDIIASARRARDLVHRLHLATRGVEEDAIGPVDVNQAVREAVQASRPRWKDEPEGKGILIEVVAEPGDIPFIKGTASRLHDIFVNLVLNAVDAMPEGGRIAIRTRSVEEGVEIAVRDTGIGMDEETRRRVFEPFFTTKVDVGTGLGLSTVYNTIVQWGGGIEVESTPGEGTTFTIRLPAWAEDGGREEARVEVPPSRRGKLLIVEDDEEVCRFLSHLLGADHEVEMVLNGRDALEAFVPGRYDVALIDMGIPGVSGDRVARQMRQADPSVVTVLITGWEIGEDDARLSLFDFRVQKPFDELGEVEGVVARAVDLYDKRAEKKS